MRSGNRKRGYSLVEAMVSAALLALGIVSVLGAYASLSKGQAAARMSEQMQRLAFDKYEEITSVGSLETQAMDGDFADRGDDRFVWTASVETTGVENLSAVTVQVQSRSGDESAQISGVMYEPPTATGGTTP